MNPVISRTLRLLFAWTVFAILLAPASLRAQTNTPSTNRVIQTRYLFLIDSSSAMRRRSEAVTTTVENLLRSGITGKLIPNDSFGIWTFKSELATGQFPLQRWTPDRAETVISNAVTFLKSRKYTGNSKFDVVIPTLERVVKNSERLVVLIISDGNEEIKSTGFDAQIAAVFKREFASQQKARMPFITVFNVSRGHIINAYVNLAPWPVFIPDFPPEPKIVEAPKPPPPKKKEAPRPTAAPLVVIGKKPPVTNAAPLIVTNAVPHAEAPVANTNAALVNPVAPTNQAIAAAATTTIPPTGNERAQLLTPTPPVLTPSVVVDAEKPTPPPSAKPDVAPLVPTAPADVKTSPLNVAKEPVPTPSKASPASEKSPTTVASMAKTNAVAAPVVALATTDSMFTQWPLIAVGIALIILAIWFFFVMRQRARDRERVSLITSSMDRRS